MKRKLLSIALVLAMLVTWIPAQVGAADGENPAKTWFSEQLTEQGRAIYDAMTAWFESGGMKDGVADYDLVANKVVSSDAVQSYLDGNRTLFNDFAAAKDAFDLQHPEAWYVDSSYLSFRVTEDTDGGLHAYMGTGRGETYYVSGIQDKADVEAKDAALKTAVSAIAAGAGAKSTDAEKIRYVHNEITKSISYRFETECTLEHAGYIRTAYALQTHEGVCEGYARSFQWVLDELGIPCVLVHGVQTSGEPEQHMWTAVSLDGAWYVVDPTWDDPIPLDKDGNIKAPAAPGLDGGETETYLLVGQDVVGKNWKPSGYVSTGAMEFTYPTMALQSYGKDTLEREGLKIEASETVMEDTVATKYKVSFKGMGVEKAAKQGYYFLVKMYDLNADGSVNAFDDWYYPAHMLLYYNWDNSSNPYFYDTDAAMTMVISQAEYVEFAITTTAPPNWQVPDDLIELGGFYSGNGTDILAESGLIFNPNGGYEAPPYVKNVSPLFNTPVYVGTNYTVHMEFTDPLYAPNQSDLDNALEGKAGDLEKVIGQAVALDYTGTTYSWGVQARQPHTFANKPEPTNIKVYCDTHRLWHGVLSALSHDCAISILEYDFAASKMWADDSVQYEFYLTGLVGKKSNKAPNNWSYVFENYSPACAYRCSAGIDWNLWGQPQLLDNPNDLDLSKIALEGVDGKQQDLDSLRNSMHLDEQDMNGRLVLVAENLSANRDSSQELSNALDVDSSAVLGSAMYEIDFARICRETVVKTGQKLRLSIGFPAGFDASMAGVTFKAYHFTRNDAGEIISVEELPITVTPYGLVLLCDSFSPFEIVALDSSKAADTSAKNTVTLINDGNGTITADAAAWEDVDSIVEIPESGSVTFTVTPREGYALDTITFSGTGEITLDEQGRFTISREDLADAVNGNAIVNVTFVPETIHAQDAEKGETVVTPEVCVHEKQEGADYLAPACTEDGHTQGKTCLDCGQTLSVSEAIPARGHIYENGKCTVCGEGEPGLDPEPEHNCAGDIFTDLDTGAWYHEYVDYMVAHGVMNGVGDNLFAPGGTTTRAMIAKILYEAEDRPKANAGNYFTDLDLENGQWYLAPVAWVAEQNLMVGADGKFRPGDPVTRQELATTLCRYAAYKGISANGNPEVISKAVDLEAVASWAAPSMAWAVESGVINGTSAAALRLDPREHATRAQVAKMVTVLFREILKTDP